MRKIIPYILCIIIGFIISSLIYFFSDDSDPTFELVAVSWGINRSDSSGASIYQIQVIATDKDKDGILDITAKGCIGSSSYFYDFGSLGTATNMSDANRNYGVIIWEKDKVLITGDTGIKSSVARNQLEKHR